jgi:FkbM family methyltransferase
MSEALKKVIRTALVRIPQVREARHSLQRAYLRVRRKPADADFACLRLFDFSPSSCFVDVGANRGQSIDAMRLYHPQQPIVAFEPNHWLARRLTEMFLRPGLTVHTCALGDSPGEFTLHVPSYNGWEFDGAAALVWQPGNMNYVRSLIIGFDQKKLTFKTMICQVRRLDEFDLPAAFIKIDTKGHELQVVRGGIETIRKHRPILMVENSDPAAMLVELAPLGYAQFHLVGGKLAEGIGFRNTIYCARTA